MKKSYEPINERIYEEKKDRLYEGIKPVILEKRTINAGICGGSDQCC